MSHYHIVIDLEMNPTAEYLRSQCRGLKHEVIEIGAVKIEDGTNRIVSEFSCLVRPGFNRRVEPKITRLTGITTAEAFRGCEFSQAMERLAAWIGPDPAKIYSWSDTDYYQLSNECRAKGIPFPEAMADWTDYQAEYPKYLGYARSRCLSLKDAAGYIGVGFQGGRAHRALCDARVTASLVLFALTEEYKHCACRIRDENDKTRDTMTYSLADACGGKLTALLERLGREEKKEAAGYGRTYPIAEPVR